MFTQRTMAFHGVPKYATAFPTEALVLGKILWHVFESTAKGNKAVICGTAVGSNCMMHAQEK